MWPRYVQSMFDRARAFARTLALARALLLTFADLRAMLALRAPVPNGSSTELKYHVAYAAADPRSRKLRRAPPRIFWAATALSASVAFSTSTARPSASSGGTPV